MTIFVSTAWWWRNSRLKESLVEQPCGYLKNKQEACRSYDGPLFFIDNKHKMNNKRRITSWK